MSLAPPKPLDIIFTIGNPSEMAFELKRYCFAKEVECKQPLNHVEAVFDLLARFGGRLAGDGFVSLFHEFFTPDSFADFCDALIEVGAKQANDLFCEAWAIYTKDKLSITPSELKSISVRRFNTKEKMDRFEQIGDEIVKQIEHQYAAGKVWSVEYAKLHRAEFEPIKQT